MQDISERIGIKYLLIKNIWQFSMMERVITHETAYLITNINQ